MASADTRELIAGAVRRFGDDVPALRSLKLVIRLELRARGDTPIWRIEVPGPKVTKDPAGDARVDVSTPRTFFNELAKDGRLEDWVEAYEHGYVKVSGDAAVIKLLGNVIQRQRARSRAV
jgi:hypothetical protein